MICVLTTNYRPLRLAEARMLTHLQAYSVTHPVALADYQQLDTPGISLI